MIAVEAADRDAEPAEHGEGDRIVVDRPAERAGNAACEQRDDSNEQAAGQTADDRANENRDPRLAERQRGDRRAEVGIVADDGERGEARGDHGANDQAARARLEGTAHFLDAEDDAGERRVEGRRDACRRAGEQEAALPIRRKPADGEHDRRADLHGRAFAAGRGAAEQAERHDNDLADADPQGNERRALVLILDMQRGDGLGNAAALRIREDVAGENRGDAEAERRDDEADPWKAFDRAQKARLREVGGIGHTDRNRADEHAAEQERAAPRPAFGRDPRAHGEMRRISVGGDGHFLRNPDGRG